MDALRQLFGGWYAEPLPLIAAAAAVLLYDRGARRLAVIAPARAPTGAQKAFLAAGVAVILVALLSPLDNLALQLQWVHMVQHVLLLVVAPPLVVLARPGRPRWRRCHPGCAGSCAPRREPSGRAHAECLPRQRRWSLSSG